MSVGITQGALDLFATEMMVLLPTHTLSYRHRLPGAVEPSMTILEGHWRYYTQQEKGANPLLVNAREYRLVITDVPFTPMRDDVLAHGAGEAWAVKEVMGGPVVSGFWRLLCTQVH